MNTEHLRSLALAAVEAAKGATQGPWGFGYNGNDETDGDLSVCASGPPGGLGMVCTATYKLGGLLQSEGVPRQPCDQVANMRFIALSRTSLPVLAEAVLALLKYAQHLDNCGHTYWELCGEDPRGRCDCGLSAALSSIDDEAEGAQRG